MQLSDEQRMFRDTLREFLENEVEPDLPEVDEKPVTKEEAIDYQLALGDLGVGPGAGDEGGFDDPLTYVLTAEEMARVWPSLVPIVNMSFPVRFAPYAGGSTRDALAEKVSEGTAVGCMAVTEPDGGSDTAHPGTTAEKDGDEWVINGEKTWVSNATIADMALVVAWNAEEEQRDYFIVDQETASFETRELSKLGWKGSPTGQVFFDDCRVPEDNRLMNAVMNMVGESDSDVAENSMFQSGNPLNTMFAYMRTGMSAMAVGIMQGAFEHALEYATDRETFDKPIAQHQLIQEKLYDMMANLEASRYLTYHAADLVQDGHEDARLLSSLAKGWVCERSVDVTYDAMQVYGANGLSTDYPLERYYRDARSMTIPDGTTEIQKLIVGKELTDMSAYK
jgi:alkylation response protein AidB-like acyl-CoA dehydrogenase